MRVGIGYDMHRFADDRRLVLGGVVVPYERGLVGHSDADVVAHALMDAILGAMRAGDIGRLFPDTDPAFKDADSIELLRLVGQRVRDAGWRIVDADIVLVLEAPKISPYRDEMRERLAAALELPVEAVGLKATTTEGLDAAGRGEGASAHAVALLERAAS